MKTGIYSLALLLAIATIALTGTDAKAEDNIVPDTTDEELLIESWMTADNFGMYPMNYKKITDHTKALQNEKLTTSPFYRTFPKKLNVATFNRSESRHSSNFIKKVKEDKLNIDNWMFDESLWTGINNNAKIFETNEEQELSIENWMVEDYYWTDFFAEL